MPEDTLPEVVVRGNYRPQTYADLFVSVPAGYWIPSGFVTTGSTGGIGLSVPVPLPPAEETLPEVVVTAKKPSWWSRFNAWLLKRDNPRDKSVGKFVLDYYVQNYMPMPGGIKAPGRRRTFGSSGGPPSIRRQRGFVGPATDVPLPAVPFQPLRPPTRSTPSAPTAIPYVPLRVLPPPVLRPALPAGYEEDEFFHPDLVAPSAPTPAAQPARQSEPAATPRGVPSPAGVPSSVPSPRPAPVPFPRTLPTPSPVPNPTPVPAPVPNPRAIPAPFALPMPIPRTASRSAPSPIAMPMPVPTPTARPTPRPNPRPAYRPAPAPGLAPPGYSMRPPAKQDQCECEDKKKKKPKKKKPRAVCYKGSYRESSKSLFKSPKERIPCQ